MWSFCFSLAINDSFPIWSRYLEDDTLAGGQNQFVRNWGHYWKPKIPRLKINVGTCKFSVLRSNQESNASHDFRQSKICVPRKACSFRTMGHPNVLFLLKNPFEKHSEIRLSLKNSIRILKPHPEGVRYAHKSRFRKLSVISIELYVKLFCLKIG